MKNASKRKFKEGETVHVIDCLQGRAICTTAKILHVSKKERRLMAVIRDNLYRRYSSEDYGRLIFDTEEHAVQVKNKLPSLGETIYQVIGQSVYKVTVDGLRSTHNHKGLADIFICLNGGAEYSIDRIGKNLFVNEEDAKNKK